MHRISRRLLGGIGIFLRRLLSLSINLWVVLILFVITFFGTRIITRNQVIRSVGGVTSMKPCAISK